MEPAANPRGTLLWWHGGGFVAGHPLRAMVPAAWIAAAAGLRAVLPTWPLAPEARWPAQAIHARAWCGRIDGPLVLGGDSAGGALALACAARARALVLLYPALGAPPSADAERWDLPATGLDPPAIRAMYMRLGASDLARRWTRGLPPTRLVIGDREPLEADAALLRTLGQVDTDTVPGRGHGFARDAGRDVAATCAMERAGEWVAPLL